MLAFALSARGDEMNTRSRNVVCRDSVANDIRHLLDGVIYHGDTAMGFQNPSCLNSIRTLLACVYGTGCRYLYNLLTYHRQPLAVDQNEVVCVCACVWDSIQDIERKARGNLSEESYHISERCCELMYRVIWLPTRS